MNMGSLEYQLVETTPGVYARSAPALVMSGRWSLTFHVTPRGREPFTATVIDRASG